MELSNNNKNMIEASERGYVVNKKGEVYFNGRKRALVFDRTGFYYSFTVAIKIDGVRFSRRIWVHKLQAYQKFGEKMFEDGIQVRHRNGRSKDNSFDNILIGSPSENQMDKSPEKRKMMAIYASYKNRKFTDDEVKKISKDRENGMTYKQLIAKYKTSKGTLSYLFNKAMYNIGLIKSLVYK